MMMWTSLWLASLAAASPSVRVVTIEGESYDAGWVGVSGTGAVLLVREGDRQEVPAEELMLIRWGGLPSTRPATSQPATIHLADGNRLYGRVTGGDARMITVSTELVPQIRLPLARLAGIRLMPSEQLEAAEAFAKALAGRDRTQDTLFVVREGRVTALKGVTESLSPSSGSFRWRERSVPIHPDTTYGIVFAAGVQAPVTPQATCVLRDGSVWAGRLTGGNSDSLTLALAEGVDVTLPVAQAVEIRFRSDRVVFLSDLEPAEFVMEPFATTSWPLRRDRSAANRPLRIGDQTFERGLGMHARSAAAYDLPGPFSRLAAVIGIDAGVAPLGNVVFRVMADEKEAFNSGPVTGRDAPRPISVSIEGAKRLQLIVEFGDELDIGDQADWGNARLIK